MGRRKRAFMDEGDSSSGSGSEDGNGNGGEFNVGRGNKRSRDTKHDAIYGIFGEDDEEMALPARGTKRKGPARDLARAPTFVSSSGKGIALSSDGLDALSGSHSSDSGAQSDYQDGLSSESDEDDQDQEQAAAREPVPEEEELATRSTFGSTLGPTAEAAEARAAVDTNGEFVPQSFVSSRGGIGSSSRNSTGAGLGLRAGLGAKSDSTAADMRAGLGSSTAGIGATGSIGARAGIGATGIENSTSQHPSFAPSALSSAKLPTSFGSTPSVVKPSSAFSRSNNASTSSSRQSTFAARPTTSIKFGSGAAGGFNPLAMMQKMGWQGGGLGKEGEGIVAPIEVQLRPSRAGIAFGGIKEKTKQAKEEAKRRGDAVSSDEEDKGRKGKGKTKQVTREKKDVAQAWTKPERERKPRKPKIEHRTYEQIIEAAGGIPSTASGVGTIIDATGAEIREVASISSALANIAVPSADTTRLPELRHNLRLICDNNKQSLDALAKEGAGIAERRRWMKREGEEAARRKNAIDAEMRRLKEVLGVVGELEAQGKAAQADANAKLEDFSPLVERLGKEFAEEIKSHHLDEAVVGAIVPLIRRTLVSWSPLSQPTLFVRTLNRWRPALGLDSVGRSGAHNTETVMTPYETLLWNLWMPRLRSAVNDDFDPARPRALVEVLEAWTPVLPRFILDNITGQLVLPKVRAAVADWLPPRGRTSNVACSPELHEIVFPWLHVLQNRFDEMLDDARRKVKSWLKGWKVKDGVPAHLSKWKEMFPSRDWESMLLSTVVPNLSSYLRTDLSIDPSAQNMEPLQAVLPWASLLRDSVISRILETEFLPKWLEVLHLWLTQPSVNFDEVAQWYTFWKDWLPTEIVALPGVALGFQRALETINQAITLGDNRSRLPKPVTTPLSRGAFATVSAAAQQRAPTTAHVETRAAITFRSVVEDAASKADLLVLPLNRIEPRSGLPILRLSPHVDGKGGVSFYVDDDVAWLERKDRSSGAKGYAPVSVEELIESALTVGK